jgi:hypothetical protein
MHTTWPWVREAWQEPCGHVVVKAASVEAIADDKWSSRAYGRGWRWSKAHSATPAAEGSHSSAHAKSRNRSAIRGEATLRIVPRMEASEAPCGSTTVPDGRTPSAQQHF